MKKTLLSLISAGILTLSALPLSAGAVYIENDQTGNYDSFIELKGDDIDIIYTDIIKNEKYDHFYLSPEGSEIIMTRALAEVVYFEPSEGASLEQIKAAAAECSSGDGTDFIAEERAYTLTHPELGYEIRKSAIANSISEDEAFALFSSLSEKGLIESFYLTLDRKSVSHWYAPYLTTYQLTDEQLAAMDAYLAEKLPDLTIEYIDDRGYALTADEDASVQVYLEAAKDIVHDLGLYPDLITPETLPEEREVLVNVHYKYGDANGDSEINMSDAVLVMQASLNPKKYGVDGTSPDRITLAGKVAADVDGDRSLTPNDALIIQRFALGLIDEIRVPETTA